MLSSIYQNNRLLLKPLEEHVLLSSASFEGMQQI